jgi:hypothetical protein
VENSLAVPPANHEMRGGERAIAVRLSSSDAATRSVVDARVKRAHDGYVL